MTNAVCRKCGCLAMGVGGSAINASGLCVQCVEEPDYGSPLHLSDKLKMHAAAERAAHPDESRIKCAQEGCSEWAREWWYFCSKKCRDAYIA